MRRAIHAAVLVLTKVVPFAPMGVRNHRVGFDNQLELFFITALEPSKKKSEPSHQYKQKRAAGEAVYLVWMMFE